MKVNRIHRTARNILQYLLNNHRSGQATTRELLIRQALLCYTLPALPAIHTFEVLLPWVDIWHQ